MNWPVAGPVSNYLRSISENLSEDIVKILRGNDEQWKYWCISVFALSADKLPTRAVIDEIKRIAENPTQEEISEEVHELAFEFVSDIEKNAP